MHQRILAASDIHSPYVVKQLGPYPEAKKPADPDFASREKWYEHRYLDLCESLEKTDVDNFIIRAPFLGFTFDVNDLGIIASIGFLMILTLYRFFLARELENLGLSFNEAKSMGFAELYKFYTLLMMRQVFTIPQSDNKSPSYFRQHVPKMLTWLPVLILVLIVVDDLSTFSIGTDINNLHAVLSVGCGIFGTAWCIWLALTITLRLRTMDRTWSSCWTELQEWKDSQIDLQSMSASIEPTKIR